MIEAPAKPRTRAAYAAAHAARGKAFGQLWRRVISGVSPGR